MFRNAARHLQPGGRFAIEVFVPDLQRLPPGETARPFHVGEHHLGFDTFDLVSQRLVSHHYWIKDGAARTFRSPHRFVWPSELDLMAKLAGLELRERWADWNQTPFTADSSSHVSVWQKPTRQGSPWTGLAHRRAGAVTPSPTNRGRAHWPRHQRATQGGPGRSPRDNHGQHEMAPTCAVSCLCSVMILSDLALGARVDWSRLGLPLPCPPAHPDDTEAGGGQGAGSCGMLVAGRPSMKHGRIDQDVLAASTRCVCVPQS